MAGNALLAGLSPSHPGEILREDILPNVGVSKAELARRLRVSRQTLYDLLGERQPVTPAMALRLGRLFGNSPEFWLNLQRDHDLRTLEPRMADELASIDRLEVEASRASAPSPGAASRSPRRAGRCWRPPAPGRRGAGPDGPACAP